MIEKMLLVLRMDPDKLKALDDRQLMNSEA
jgi:hypothetical protein